MGCRVVGDVHGKTKEYLNIVKDVEYSFQLGDMGFDYKHMDVLDSNIHLFQAGNHENFDKINKCPNYIGNMFGMCSLGGVEFFHVGGAYSIDMPWRHLKYVAKTSAKSWWEKEQMDFSQMLACYNLYKEVKPDLVISHTCPTSVSNKMFSSDLLEQLGYNKRTFFCHTASLLDEMFMVHQPKKHIFGHFHQSKSMKIKNTDFQCLAELEYVDLEN
jgi:hypothetical protein